MNDLEFQIQGAESQLNNLKHAKGSIGRSGALLTSEQLDTQIAAQAAVVQSLREQMLQTIAAPQPDRQ